MNDTTREQMRHQISGCFERGADALFNLADALLSESQAQSLPELSVSAFFERKWPSVYEALEDGRINTEKLRALWVRALLAQKGDNEPICIAVDASTIERPNAETSAHRGIIHLPNLPMVDKPLRVGWQFSSVVLLPEQPSSWTPILDQQRISTEQTPIQVAIGQLRALKPLFGDRQVIVLADRGYGSAEFLRACSDLGSRILVRMKSERKLYRPGVRIHKRGPTPKDGPLLQGKHKETHADPETVYLQQDSKGRSVRISRWGNLHFKPDRDLMLQVIGVEREAAKGTKRDPRVSCFVTFDDALPLWQIPQ